MLFDTHVLLWALSTPNRLPDGIRTAIEDAGFGMLPLTAAHAGHLRALPFHHRDPFDRMIIAQALAEDIAVASVDETFLGYSVKLVF